MTYRQDLWEIASEHHGVVTTRQANDAGVPSVEVRKLAARGALARVGHGVYRHTGVPSDDRTELAAKLAEAGEDAFLEGDTVLAMFDLALVNPVQVYIGTPRRRRGNTPKHTVITYRPRMPAGDLTVYENLRCVTVHRALLDAVSYLLGDRVREAVAAARRRELIDDGEATEICEAVAARNRQLTLDD